MERLIEWNRSTLFSIGLVRPIVIAIALIMAACQPGQAEEAEWIWTPQQAKEDAPKGSCYFRKSFVVRTPERIQLTIAADDEYELYVNGRKVGVGESYRELDEYDITPVIDRGRNTIAVKVTNRRGSTAALVARVMVKERNSGWVSHSTDGSWLVNTRPLPLWTTAIYNDRMWDKAQSFGMLGSTPPWDVPEDVASDETHRHERFRINKEFEVQRVIDAEETGSLIAMTFNEFGHVIASREGGPLLLIFDSNDDKIVDTVRVYCDKVKNVQGILPLNGDVYVTADGPDGSGLYRLSDSDRDGSLETTKLLFNFEGEVGEHSAHGITLGVDGWIYIVIGNHTQPTKDYDPGSPHRGYYEGDLCRPRYEDPGGHAANRKAPGGAAFARIWTAKRFNWSQVVCATPMTWRSAKMANCSSMTVTWNRTKAQRSIDRLEFAMCCRGRNSVGEAVGQSGPSTTWIHCLRLPTPAVVLQRVQCSTTTTCFLVVFKTLCSWPIGLRAAFS